MCRKIAQPAHIDRGRLASANPSRFISLQPEFAPHSSIFFRSNYCRGCGLGDRFLHFFLTFFISLSLASLHLIIIVDPFTSTLSGVGIFFKGFSAIKSLYSGYKLTRSFGDDFGNAQRALDIQHARVDEVSRQKPSFISTEYDLFNEDDPVTKAVISNLVLIEERFQVSYKLLKKYKDIESQVEVDQEDLSEYAPTLVKNTSGPSSIAQSNTLSGKSNNGSQRITHRENPKKHQKEKSDSFLRAPLRSVGKIFKKKRDKVQSGDDKESLASGQETSPSVSGALPRINLLQPDKDIEGNAIAGAERGHQATEQRDDVSEASTLIPEAGISSLVVANEIKKAKEHALALKGSNNFYRRVKWADHDRRTLLNVIVDLRRYNNDLEALIRLKVPEDPTEVLGVQTLDQAQIQHTEQVQVALKRLHETLMSANRHCLEANAVALSVQVIEDFEQAAADLIEQAENLDFRDDALVFVLQAHQSNTTEGAAVLLYAETKKTVSDGTPDQREQIQRIKQIRSAIEYEELLAEPNPYQVLGSVFRDGNPADSHHIFYYTKGFWQTSRTLNDVLDQEDFKMRLTKAQRMQLARLIAISFLSFAKVISSTSLHPRPDHLRFYKTDGQEEQWIEEEPFVLNPYVSIGFGAPKPIRVPGSTSGVARQISNPVVELGLVLYQVGSCCKLDYGAGLDGVAKAKREALRMTRNIDEVCGGHFTEVVQICLDWGSSLSAPASLEDYQLIQRIIAWLRNQEERSRG